MIKELIAQGAEAKIFSSEYLGKKTVLKERVPKGYRNSELDEIIRFERARDEAMLLQSARKAGVRSPAVYRIDKKNAGIEMEKIKGERLKDCLSKENVLLCRLAGEQVSKLHSAGIVHGDLTTSNMIVEEDKSGNKATEDKTTKRKTTENKTAKNKAIGSKTIAFIDFGLGFKTNKEEDFAVDLLNFKKTYEATHCSVEDGWKLFLEGYLAEKGKKEIVSRIAIVEGRGRYH